MFRRTGRTKKRGLAAVAAIVVTLSLALVAGGSAKSNTTTLTLLASTTQQASMQILIANFKRVYPDIDVQAEYIASSQFDTVLPIRFQAGNAPDIMRVGAGNRGTGTWVLAKAGRLLDLSGAPWNARIYPPMTKYYKYQGKVVGWPDSVQPFGTIYNVDMFKQNGWTVPTTMPQLLSLCQKITAAGKIPMAQGWKDVSTANVWIPQRAANYVYNTNPNWNVDKGKGKTTFATSTSWQQALGSIVAMKDAGCFQKGAEGNTRPQAYNFFGTGQAAMIQVAASEIPNAILANPSINYQMFNLPGDNAKNGVVYMPAPTGFSVNGATSHPKEAKTFIAFMAREQQSTLFAKVGGTLSTLDVKKGRYPAYMTPLKPYFTAGKYVGAFHSGWPNSRVFDEALAPCVLGLITGQTTPQTCLANADTIWAQGAS